MKNYLRFKGFALIEILIALTIISLVLLSVYTGVTASINVIMDTKNFTKAMIIAKTKLNEFIIEKMRGADVSNQEVEKYPGFYFSRITERYEHALLGPIPAKKTEIIVKWKEKNNEKKFNIYYIYPESYQ